MEHERDPTLVREERMRTSSWVCWFDCGGCGMAPSEGRASSSLLSSAFRIVRLAADRFFFLNICRLNCAAQTPRPFSDLTPYDNQEMDQVLSAIHYSHRGSLQWMYCLWTRMDETIWRTRAVFGRIRVELLLETLQSTSRIPRSTLYRRFALTTRSTRKVEGESITGVNTMENT